MSDMCSRELERELIETARTALHDKIDRDEYNGDVLDTILLVLLSTHRRVGECSDNPMMKLGEFFREYPKMVLPTLLITWALLGASTVMAVIGFMNATGLTVNHLP